MRRKILGAIDVLSGDPRPAGYKDWRARRRGRRVRDSAHLRIHDQVLLVIVVDIGHRREIYR